MNAAAARIARRLVRKAVKSAALMMLEAQLRSNQARVEHFSNPPRMLVPVQRKAHKRRIELIARRNQIQGW